MLKIISQLKYIISSVLLLVLSVAVSAQEIDGVVAVVEDHIVLLSDVEVQYQQMMANGMTGENLKCEILNQLLLDKMYVVEAERDSIIITNEEVDNELNRRIEYFVSIFGSEEQLEEYYGKTLFDLKEEFRDDIYQQLLSDRMQGSIFSDIYIAPSEVFDFFNEIPKDSLPFFNAEVEIGQIVVFAEPNILQKEAARKKAEEIREELVNGGDFEFQALLYSDDPGSSSQGGNLGFVKRGDLVTPFEAAAFRLEVNEISSVVETQFGYHIIQMLEKQGQRVSLRHILITPDISNDNVIEAEKEMNEILTKMRSGEVAFQKGVALYSEDELTKNNGGLLTNPETGNTFFEMDELEGDIAVELAVTNQGEFTEVLPYATQDGKYGYRIIYLKSETAAHQASLEQDYTKIKAVAKQAKQAEKLNAWLAEKSNTVYVRIDAPFNQCTILNNWMN